MSPRPAAAVPAPVPASSGRGVANGRELRCECGSLLARIERGEIELKCRRCKRVIVMRPGAFTNEILGACAHCGCSRD